MHKIQRVSFYFRWLLQIAFCVFPVLYIVSWMQAPNELNIFQSLRINAIPLEYRHAIFHTLSNSEKFQGFLVDLIPIFIDLYIIGLLIKLFGQFQRGNLFTKLNIQTTQRVGFALFATQMVAPFCEVLMGYVLTWNNPPHKKYLAFSFSQNNFAVLLIAFVVMLISWVIMEGYNLYQEQQLTV